MAGAEIAGEEDSYHGRTGDLHFHRRGSKQVAGVPEPETDALRRCLPCFEFHRSHQRHGKGCVFGGIDGRDGQAAPTPVAAVQVLDFALLNMGGVRQHHGAEIDRAGRGKDRPVEIQL